MGEPSDDRATLVADMHLAGREISTAAVLFHSAVAERRGLSATDEKALDVLLRLGPLTHAELARHTGLAPASVTGLIDRLERKGFATRKPHPDDRRRVLVSADAEQAFAVMAPLFADWVGELEALYARYADDELRVIADFMHRAAEAQQLATERLDEAPQRLP
jgi:DNA-binding MarR family transcriptional regulator